MVEVEVEVEVVRRTVPVPTRKRYCGLVAAPVLLQAARAQTS